MWIIDDIFKAIRAIAEAVKARYDYKGLSMQEKQDDEKRDSELATRLLTLIYKYRDAMEDFMDSFMVSVPDLPKEEAPHLNKEQRRFQAYANFEQKRSDAVASVRQEFYDDILTSEALWGDEIRKIVEEMHIIEKFARKRVEQQLRTVNPDNSQMARKTSDKILENMKSDEELSKKFNKLVKEAERYLKQKMQ